MKRPLLSICIPTYNRATYLKQALESYVNNDAFDDDVEIIISDNASTDETQSVGEDYALRFHNVKYFKNDRNVNDSNFCLALDRASGLYRKLMNDNLKITNAGLKYIKERIKEHLEDKAALFFSNGIIFNHAKEDKVVCNSLGDFVQFLSFNVTAIYCFGGWREDWQNVKNRLRYTQFKLNQDDWAYQIVENKGGAVLYSGQYFQSLTLNNKYRKGYNWFEVHVENYYKILQPYIDRGIVTKNVIKNEKRTYILNLRNQLVICYLFNIYPEWQFDMSGTTKILWKYFKGIPLFYLMMFTLPIWGGIKVLLYHYRKYLNECKW